MIWDALRDLPDVDVRDLRVRGYGGKPIRPRGVLEHHTASSAGSGDLPSLHICQKGRADLPGPLCQVLIGRAGTVAVITDGYANHAGTGSWPGITNGNEQLVGVEIENDGRGEKWTPGVMRVATAVTGRLCQRFNLPVELVLGHKEWAKGRKIDPTFDMGQFRVAVRTSLTPVSPPAPPSEDDMPLAIIRADSGDQTWWVTDFVSKRALADGNELQDLRTVHRAQTNLDGSPMVKPRAWVDKIPTR